LRRIICSAIPQDARNGVSTIHFRVKIRERLAAKSLKALGALYFLKVYEIILRAVWRGCSATVSDLLTATGADRGPATTSGRTMSAKWARSDDNRWRDNSPHLHVCCLRRPSGSGCCAGRLSGSSHGRRRPRSGLGRGPPDAFPSCLNQQARGGTRCVATCCPGDGRAGR
jgi:hypothetical protein